MPDPRVDAPNLARSTSATHPLPLEFLTHPFVYVQTLGDFRLLVVHPQGHWVEITQHLPRGHGRARELLALLMTQRRALSRDEAAKTLWPDKESRDRSRRLRNALYYVRQSLVTLHSQVTQSFGIATTEFPQLRLQDTATRLTLLVIAPQCSSPDDAGCGTPVSLPLPLRS